MSFWDKVAGASQPTPSAPPLPPLGYPMPQVPQQYQQHPQTYQQDPEQERVAVAMAKAQHTRNVIECPECGPDGDIFKPKGMPNAMPQCYTCGWNPRYTQSTAGAGMPSTSETGPPRPSRQVSTANNYNPQQIVGTVTL